MSKRKDTPKIELPSTIDDLSGLAPKQPTDQPGTKKKEAASKRKKMTGYYIGDEVKEEVRKISVQWGVSASQVAKYLLVFGIKAFKAETLPPPTLSPSDSPAYRNNIQFKDE